MTMALIDALVFAFFYILFLVGVVAIQYREERLKRKREEDEL